MISLEDVGFSIGSRKLFSGISLSILPASLVRICGGNGSGKSTFLRMLARIIKPSSGKILKTSELQSYIGHSIAVKDDLTVREQLEFWAGLEGTEMLIPAALSYMKLLDYEDDYCYKLSAGNKQKIALARLMLSKSMIWILDEADTSLDERNLEIYKSLISTKVQNNGIVIYSSHRDIFKDTFQINMENR